MNKQAVIWFLSCFTSTASAQWGDKDSVWLQDILSGKQQIQLNPETMKAIESGDLINFDFPENKPLMAPPFLPILKEFEDILADNDSAYNKVDPVSLPPSVYKLHVLLKDSSFTISEDVFKVSRSLLPKDEIQVGKTPVSISAGAKNLFLEEVKDGQKRGSVGGSAIMRFSFESMLLGIFSKKERAKRRNRKKATIWKHYNRFPEHQK